MKFCIFTKPIHVEKIVNFLNSTKIDYLVSTSKLDVFAYDFDIGISYCFDKILDVEFGDRKWFNYHPAPLPEYPGICNYVIPIKDRVKQFGVTLHKMNNKLDDGEIMQKRVFKLSSVPVHHNELGCITHYYLFQLFKETIGLIETWVKVDLR